MERDYIERNAVLEEALNNKAVRGGLADETDIKEIINDVHSADVVSVKHGKWRASKSCGVLPTNKFVCSECDGLVIISTYRNRCLYNYCPNCGAKMDGD